MASNEKLFMTLPMPLPVSVEQKKVEKKGHKVLIWTQKNTAKG